jgi:hypothetical protein
VSIVHLRAGETERDDGTVEYVTEAAAVRYAINAGFKVKNHGTIGFAASRDDVPHDFRLMEIPGKKTRYAWEVDR